MNLLANVGIEGDYHRGGDRQVSLLSAEVRQWVDAQAQEGLCFRRFRENMLIDGSIDGMALDQIESGMLLSVGSAVLRVSGRGKRCFDECALFAKGIPCRLSQCACFAAVTQSGIVRIGDSVSIDTNENCGRKKDYARKKDCEPMSDLTHLRDLTHFDAQGNAAMVDVSEKAVTQRQATATGQIRMCREAYQAVRQGSAQKGDVLGVARVAGIMAVKQTSSLIPLCHSLPINQASIDFAFDDEQLTVSAFCTVKTSGITGVEMEALTGVSIALLTVYDMCKAIDKGMELGSIYLLEKTGGKSGAYQHKGHKE